MNCAATASSQVTPSAPAASSSTTQTPHAPHRVRKAAMALLCAVALCLASVGAVYAIERVMQVPSYTWYTDNPSASEFTIKSAADLRGLSDIVNGTAPEGIAQDSFAGKTVRQSAGYISLANEEFTPIGTAEHPFEGTFVGAAGTGAAIGDIRSLTITQGSSYVGLFGYCGGDSLIKNVRLSSSSSGTTNPSSISIADEGEASVDAGSVLHDIGSVVGYTAGSIENCTSEVPVTVKSNRQATAADPLVIANVGGIAGTVVGSVSDCAYAADMTVETPSLASDTSDAVAASIGGVVGVLGQRVDERTTIAGTISNCTNGVVSLKPGNTQTTLHVVTTGVGGLDRFGVEKEATALSVGGVAGYSFGSIANSSNYGLVNTNHKAASLFSATGGILQLTDPADNTHANQYASDLFALANGSSDVGGVVGSLRSSGMGLSAVAYTSDAGTAESAISVFNCFNEGCIVGLAQTGGVVGTAGTYADISDCRNGKLNADTGIGTSDNAGHVVTTRWNKPFTGGIAGSTYSNLFNCSNVSEVENIQTGYYTAGIVGGLWSPNAYTSEVYSCFNSGLVHVASYATLSYREAGLVGNNNGYVHDSVMRSGCVLAHDDEGNSYPNAAIGDDSWGKWSNLKFFKSDELKKSEAAAVLNAGHANDVLTKPESEWEYWYISGAGYPTLNTWVPPTNRTDLTAGTITATCSTLAEYTGNVEAIPTLVVTYAAPGKDAVALVQNVDFYAIPQKGATDMTDGGTPYKASIIGIGNYQGLVSDVCSYGIGPCSVKSCDISVSSETYNFDVPVYPKHIYVTNPGGSQISENDIRYEIYDGTTYSLTSGNQKRNVIFDSEGFVSWDGGATRSKVSTAENKAKLCSDLTGIDYMLYNMDGEPIFKVENATQYIVDPLTGKAEEGFGPVYYKAAREGVTDGGLAGYIVKVSPKAGASGLEEGTWSTGQYVINAIDLYKDATIDELKVTVPTGKDGAETQTYTWYWDSEKSTLYTVDAEGNRVTNPDGSLKQAAVTFTGAEIDPTVQVSFTDANGVKHTLKEDRILGYYLVYGDLYSTIKDRQYVNRDATPRADLAAGTTETDDEKALREQLKNHDRAAVTVRSVLQSRFSNYVHMYFAIDPAELSTCTTTIAGTPVEEATGEALKTFAYTGGYAVRPSVEVNLNGNALVKGTDFTVTYDNNTEATTDEALQAYYENGDTSGLASYTVTGLGNVTGSYIGYFAIAQGRNLAEEGYTIKPVADQQYNFGQPVQAPGGVELLDAQGNKASLVEGVDYTVSYSNNVYTGVAGIAVQGINAYTGRLHAQFNIRQFDMAANYDERTTGWVFERPEWESEGVEYGYGTGVYMRGYAITNWAQATPDKENDYLIEFEWTAVNKATGQVFRKTVGSSHAAYMTPGDYTVTYTPTCLVAVLGSNSSLTYQNMYTGTLTRDVTITKQDIAKRTWIPLEDVAYNGHPQELVASSAASAYYWIAGDMQKLTDPNDFSVEWRDNVAAGTATYTVCALPQSELYTGTYVGTFNITKLDVAKATISVADQLYTGKPLTPEVTVSVDGQTLTAGADYTVEYVNNTSRGTATVKVEGKGSCEGTATATFTIGNRLKLSQAQVAPIADQLYTGSAVTPKPVVTLNGKTLVEGTDYTLSYSNNTQVSTDTNLAKVTVTGKNGTYYAGSSTSATFKIVKTRDISVAQAAEIPDQVYTGQPITPTVSITYDGKQLTQGTDYTVEYRRNIKAGAPATAVAIGKGTFEGQLEVPFNIVVKNGEVARVGEGAETPQEFALAVARDAYPYGSQDVIVANERDYAAQSAAATYAAQQGWPVLLTSGNGQTLSASTLAYIRECGASQALILGSDATVAAQVQSTLEAGLNLQVQRIDATDEQDLSRKLAAMVIEHSQSATATGKTPLAQTAAALANPDDLEGAAAMAAYATARNIPLYYTASDGTIDQQTQEALGKLQTLVVAGDYTQVDAQVEASLGATVDITRLAGDTRYGESAAITAYALANGLQATGSVVANAPNLTHQLTALALCAKANAPLVLASTQSMEGIEALAQAQLPPYGITLLGGESAFPATLASTVTQSMNW